MLKKSLLLGTVGVMTIGLSGCSTIENQWNAFNEWWQPGKAITSVINPYRPDMQQGNLVTQEMIEQLHVGMTKLQVQFLLGVPLLRDMFHQNRWDYVYYLNPRFGDPERRRLTVFFDENERLQKYEFTPMPSETLADQIILDKEGAEFVSSDEVTVVDQEQQIQKDIEQSAR